MSPRKTMEFYGKPGGFLVLLPGMACDGSVWSPQTESLQDVCDCCVPDYGAARSFEAMARNALRSLPERFYLAGHSMGGRVALEMIRMAPERVKALCLVSTEARARDAGEAGAQETRGRHALLEIARRDGMEAMAEALLPKLLGSKVQGNENVRGKILTMIAKQALERVECQIAAGESRPDSRESARQIRCRTLVIGGEEDALKPASGTRELASLIPDSELTLIPQCGHMPTLENPELVSSLMRKWLVIDDLPVKEGKV